MSAAPLLATKSQFAAMIGRDPAFVTRAIGTGKLTADALEGSGRSARIRIDAAKRQLGMALDLGQQLAQKSPLIFADAFAPALAPGGPAADGEIDTPVLHREREEQIRLRNAKLRLEVERGERDAAAASGELVDRAGVAAALTRQFAFLATVFDEIPQALAKTLSEQFGIGYAELLIAIKAGVRTQRTGFAERVRATAAQHAAPAEHATVEQVAA